MSAIERPRVIRLAAYVVCIEDGRILLTRWIGPGGPQWTVPGGGLDLGEHPQLGALRELFEETGYGGAIDALLGVDVDRFVNRDGADMVGFRILYRGRITGGSLTHEVDGSTDQAAWQPLTQVANLDAVPLVRTAIVAAEHPGRPVVPLEPSGPAPAPETVTSTRLLINIVLINENDQLLLVDADDVWTLPSAELEFGEPIGDAAIRVAHGYVNGDAVPVGVRTVDSNVMPSSVGCTWELIVTCDVEIVAGIDQPLGSRWFGADEVAIVTISPAALAALGS